MVDWSLLRLRSSLYLLAQQTIGALVQDCSVETHPLPGYVARLVEFIAKKDGDARTARTRASVDRSITRSTRMEKQSLFFHAESLLQCQAWSFATPYRGMVDVARTEQTSRDQRCPAKHTCRPMTQGTCPIGQPAAPTSEDTPAPTMLPHQPSPDHRETGG